MRQYVAVRIFRELHQNDDDPFRRETRRNPSPTKDEGDLFIHRPSPRKLRILVDVEHLPADTSTPVGLFETLVRHRRIFHLDIAASSITSTAWSSSVEPGRISVRDTTASAGAFSYPGPQYSWSIDDEDAHPDGSSTLGHRGSTHPLKQIWDTAEVYRKLPLRDRIEFRLKDAVTLTIMAEIVRDAGFDILVSEAPAARCGMLPVHDRAVTLSRAEAVPVIAHYLRRQHIFLFDPHSNAHYSRHDFYQQSVHTLAPALKGWEERFGFETSGVGADVRARYLTAVNRLARALESRDDIIWSLGSHLVEAVREDCLDDFDHLLLMLCGGVDVMARALHFALGLDVEKVRSAKLHVVSAGSWYASNIVERYGSNPAERNTFAELSRLQADLQVIFELRNSVHNVRIRIVYALFLGARSSTDKGGSPYSAHIMADIVDRIKAIGPDVMSEWGLQETADRGAVADLWELADKAVRTAFSFLDLLSSIVLRNPLPVSASTFLSGPALASPRPGNYLEAAGEHLPVLLGFSNVRRGAIDLSSQPRVDEGENVIGESSAAESVVGQSGSLTVLSVQETWWRAHIRLSIATLRGAHRIGSPDIEGASWAHEEWINDALEAERRHSGREWPDSMTIARTVITSYSTDFV